MALVCLSNRLSVYLSVYLSDRPAPFPFFFSVCIRFVCLSVWPCECLSWHTILCFNNGGLHLCLRLSVIRFHLIDRCWKHNLVGGGSFKEMHCPNKKSQLHWQRGPYYCIVLNGPANAFIPGLTIIFVPGPGPHS